MKILYGIQGTGNGHISRSRVMAKHLNETGADVTYLFSGREKDKLFEMDIFGEYEHRQGLTFVTQNGKISHLRTCFKNNVIRFIYDVFTLPVEQYDLVITDFEPVSAWAAKVKKVPVLGIGHQYAFGKNTPVAGETKIARFILDNFAPATESIGLHWHPFNANVLPPIIDTSLVHKSGEDFVLVYLPFENQLEVTQLLNQFSQTNFILYSPELVDRQIKNVTQRATSYKGFKRDLAHAKGVICNSGFELISECLHIGLPILTKPINGQMEQESNALALSQLSLAETMLHLDQHHIATWLDNVKHPSFISRPTPDVAKAIVAWMMKKQWHNTSDLIDKFWQAPK